MKNAKLWLILLLFSFTSFAGSLTFLYMPIYLKDIGFKEYQIGILYSIISGISLTSFALGLLINSIGILPILRLSLMLSATMLILLAFGVKLLVAIALIVLSLASTSIILCIYSYLPLVTGGVSGFSYGILNSIPQAIGVFGMLIGGYVIACFGYAKAFYVSSLIMVLALLLTLSMPISIRSVDSSTNISILGFGEMFRRVIGYRVLLLFLVATSFSGIVNTVFRIYLPLYLKSIGYDITDIGLIMAPMMIAMLTQPIFGRLSDRVGELPNIFLGWLLSGIFIILIPILNIPTNIVMSIIFSALIGICGAISSPAVISFIARYSGDMRPTFFGLQNTLSSMISMIAPILGAITYQYDPNSIFYVMSLTSFVQVCMLIPVRRFLDKKVGDGKNIC